MRKKLITGSVGASAELFVCQDLLLKGFEVFRAVSPSTSCDLILKIDKKLYRLEVKRRSFEKSWKKIISTDEINPKKEYLDYDIIAFMFNDGLFYYDNRGRLMNKLIKNNYTSGGQLI